MYKFFLVSISFILLTSCVSIEPPSMKSPCTSIESSDPNVISPCVKRPVNTWIG